MAQERAVGATWAVVEGVAQAVLAAVAMAWPGEPLALILYGSAHRGDFVPFCSDLNLRLILSHGCFGPHGGLDPARVALARLALEESVELPPFRSLNLEAWDVNDMAGRMLVPGCFALLYGSAELHAPREWEMLAQSRLCLAKLPERIAWLSRALLRVERGGLLALLVDAFREVTRALRQLWAVENLAPFASWQLPRLEIATGLAEPALAEGSASFLRDVAALCAAGGGEPREQVRLLQRALQLLEQVHLAARAAGPDKAKD